MGHTSGEHDVTGIETPLEAKDLMADVKRHELPPVLARLVDEYRTFDGARDRFTWKWVHSLAPQNTLPCVDDAYRDRVPIDKTITTLFVTLLDDLLERDHDPATFHEMAKLVDRDQDVNPDRPEVDTAYVEFATTVWETLLDRLQEAPRYDDYEQLFRYDLKQAINAIEYSALAIERPDLATMTDLERYQSHNMVMFGYADLDLMYSPGFDDDDLDTLRSAIRPAQQMARIGNWLSTWEREVDEGDYSSGVIVYALQNDVVDLDDLRAVENGDENARRVVVQEIREQGIEAEFLRRWNEYDVELRQIGADLTMDITPYADGLEEVLRYHLASRGLK